MAIMQAPMAYTSAPTALDQTLSVQVKVSAPTKALPRPAASSAPGNSSGGPVTFNIRITIDQNMNKIATALARPDMKLIIRATWLESAAKVAKKAPII